MTWYSWGDLRDQLARIENKLDTLKVKETKMAIDVSAITAEVQRNTDVTKSVVQLVQNLANQIASIPPSNDPQTQAALDQLKNTLTQNDDQIAAAVTANTTASNT